MGYNRCGYFDESRKKKINKGKAKESNILPKAQKKGAENPRQASEGGAMIGMLPNPSPQWWEMLDWVYMKETYKILKPEIKEKIKKAGLAPKGEN